MRAEFSLATNTITARTPVHRFVFHQRTPSSCKTISVNPCISAHAYCNDDANKLKMACMHACLLENMFFCHRPRVLNLFDHSLSCHARVRDVFYVNFKRIARAWSIFVRMLLDP